MTSTRSIWIKSLVVGLLMICGGFFWFSRSTGFSVLLGVLLALTNFWLLERLIRGIAQGQTKKRFRLALQFIAKLALIFGLLALVVTKVPIEGWALLVGLSVIVIGILLEGLVGTVRTQDHA